MDKQLLEQEALVHYPKIKIEECAGPIDFDKRNVQNQQLRWAYIAGATSSSTVKELEREVERLKEFLGEIELYFDNKADVDFIGESQVPNEEAKILYQIRELIN